MTSTWITPNPEDDPAADEAAGFAWAERRRHTFTRKARRRPNVSPLHYLGGPRNITLSEFETIYSAADFALVSHLCLDMHVTIHFGLMDIFDPAEVQAELNRFLKCYGSYAREEKFVAAWIYSVEMGSHQGVLSHHAHIALYVPGQLANEEDHARMRFRKWARGYTERNLGRHVPRAIKVSGRPRARPLAHWIVTTYLMKGCDRHALVQSRRTTPDGLDLTLGDLMPWPYVDPGPVATTHRVRASHNLGPKQRAFGAPAGMEPDLLKYRWDVTTLNVDAPPKGTRVYPLPRVPIPQPFRSRFEDGVRDVRELFGHNFYRFVMKREPYDTPVPVVVERECLTCQLRGMADE